MPATSEVWTYFTRSVDKKSVTCKLCSVRLSYMGTTTNLWNHVKAKHPSSQSESSKQQSMKKFTVSGLKHDLCSGCFGQTLQLAIKPAFALPDVNRVVSRCRKLVGHIKHSTTLTAEMRKRQATLKVPKHELVQDVTTRWNITHAILARLNEQRRVLSDLMLDTRVTRKADQHLSLKDGEWTVVSELSDVLSHLTETTSYMSTEKNVSCSEVYLIVTSLLDNTLRACEADSHVVKEVKGVIAAELRRRFRPSNDATATSTLVLAALLDPRYKDLDFLSTEQRRYTEDALESRLDDVPFRLPTPTRVRQHPPNDPVLASWFQRRPRRLTTSCVGTGTNLPTRRPLHLHDGKRTRDAFLALHMLLANCLGYLRRLCHQKEFSPAPDSLLTNLETDCHVILLIR